MSDTITVEYPIERLPDGHVRVDVGDVWKRSESEWRKFLVKYPTEPLYQAVVKWLDENPPKPAWHDAKPGEGWTVTWTGKGPYRAVVQDTPYGIYFRFVTGLSMSTSVKDRGITDARLEWPLPEDDND